MTKDPTNIIITGSDGYVGKNLKDALATYKGLYEIYEFNTENYFYESQFAHDWQDFTSSIPQDISYIVHLGAITDSQTKNLKVFHANTLATGKIALSARNARAKMIFFSSAAAIDPKGLYGWSKRLAEDLIRQIVPYDDLCILRPFNIYGEDESRKINPSIHWKLKRGFEIPIYKDCFRDFVHVKDVCNAVRSLMSKTWQSGTYDLGTGKMVSTRALYQAIYGVEAPQERLEKRPDHVANTLVARKDRMLKGVYCLTDVLNPDGKEAV